MRYWTCLLAVVMFVRVAAAEDTQKYVVRAGDSCISIAIRVVGDRSALDEIHRLNPQLGRAPHHLVEGTVLVLPASKPSGPDARLTRAFGSVRIRTPTSADWDPAQRGADLYRAYRVGAASQSSAEMKFADDSLLGMRERTIVVIYGPEKRTAKVITATAELEKGTLESRLGELDGKPLVVRTADGETDLRAGEVVIASTDSGSVLSNHGGNAVELRGRTKARSAVKVAAGMGTRVVAGKPPEAPRPLPPTPTWITSAGPHIATPQGTITFAWNAAERAAQYRVAIRDRSGELIAARVVAAPTSSLDLAVAPGAYEITVAAFDSDGLESIPSAPLAVQRIVPAFVPPGGQAPSASAATPTIVAAGTTVIAPDGVACSIGGTFSERLVIDRPGTVSLQCKDASQQTSEPLQLTASSLSNEAHIAPVMNINAAVAPPQVVVAANRWELGAYIGFHSVAVRRPLDLGLPADRASTFNDGPTLGVRGGMLRGHYGVEAEVGFSSVDRAATSGSATLVGVAAHAVAVHEEDRVSLRLLAGAHVTTIASDNTHDAGSGVVSFSWGGAASYSFAPIDLRIDLRHELGPGFGGGVGQALLATIGASLSMR